MLFKRLVQPGENTSEGFNSCNVILWHKNAHVKIKMLYYIVFSKPICVSLECATETITTTIQFNLFVYSVNS